MRDIDKLSGMGIPVYTQPGYEGGVFLAPEYSLNRSFFSALEVEDIILAFHIINHLKGRDGKSSVLKKIESLVPELAFLKESDLAEYLKIELIEKPVRVCTTVCKTINAGLNDEVFLEITVDSERYSVAPMYYILRPDGLYIYCKDDKQDFTFRIDNISECEKTAREFDRADYQATSPEK